MLRICIAYVVLFTTFAPPLWMIWPDPESAVQVITLLAAAMFFCDWLGRRSSASARPR